MIFDLYKLGKEIAKDANHLFGHSGKDDLGEKILCDSHNQKWKVKVRCSDKRGRYLKIYSYPDGKKKLRASADQYKYYLRITSDEWELLYQAVAGQNNSRVRAVLDRLVGI
ncbi:hypothetical protein HCG51_32445 [Tolypothrix sp. PCC 7910]|uniref:hypothetical protein n=1 Tax=Tolypothrix sp. PCC 7910 TaxID=2099387 RepID=UPI0014277BD1|nr:hypothetical protein [Tolypothrix sp. PCC 7910]QIR40929.1 hypothetical protein HCG51_32445 [Tolypothrix sp. PCC 7910]